MMRIFTLALALLFVQSNAQAAEHSGFEVRTIQGPDTRTCTFFQLNGVGTADPNVITNNPWFTLPQTHAGHDVIVSMLLTSLTTGKKLDVVTSGNTACGHAEVLRVTFSFN